MAQQSQDQHYQKLSASNQICALAKGPSFETQHEPLFFDIPSNETKFEYTECPDQLLQIHVELQLSLWQNSLDVLSENEPFQQLA
jgi:hypothetical protein